MYVRKFEADTLDEALKSIKLELGPDAIILKTITNKGLKGAFKKKKIEITAAISEKSYVKKSNVDQVLEGPDKQTFYNNNSQYVSQMIDNYDSNSNGQKPSGYGKMGVNKPVSTISTSNSSPLDDFLNTDTKEVPKEIKVERPVYVEEPIYVETPAPEEYFNPNIESSDQQRKIDELEKKLFDLTKFVEKYEDKGPVGPEQLRTSLRSLDISEQYIQKIIQKAVFELNERELEDTDTVFEFALREMISEINTDMPKFSTLDEDQSTITVFLTDCSSGQSSMVTKVGALKNNSIIIRYDRNLAEKTNSFSEKIFGMDVCYANSIAEVVSQTRKAYENNSAIFLDIKASGVDLDETKKLIDGLNRSFGNIEVIITINAINSEIYNRKIITKYKELSQGLVVTHVDECLNFGSLFNITNSFKELPFKFFGTGKVVPDDIESATAERILAGMFEF